MDKYDKLSETGVVAGEENNLFLFICVLGVHRSGTSAASGLLSTFGFHPGKDLLLPSKYNSHGYYECQPIVKLNDQILKSSGRKWSDVRGVQTANLPRGGDLAKFVATGSTIFQAEFNDYEAIVIKDPRLAHLYPFWRNIFRQKGRREYIVITLRHPSEVTASLRERDGFSENKAAALYVSYMLNAELNTRGTTRVVWDFDSIINDWRGAIKNLQTELGAALPIFTKDSESQADNFITRELKHQHSREWSGEVGEFDVPMRLALEVYHLLQFPISKDTEAALDHIRLRFESYIHSLSPWLADSYELELLAEEILSPHGIAREVAGSTAQSVLYWRSKDSDLSEYKAIRHPWKYGSAFNLVRFVFDQRTGVIEQLRWDITDRPAFIRIFSLLLEDSMGGVLWTWQPGSDLFEPPSDGFFVLSSDIELLESVDFVTTGFDPNFYLKIPTTILCLIKPGCVLSAKFTAEMPSASIPYLIGKISKLSEKLCKLDADSSIKNEREKYTKLLDFLQREKADCFLESHSKIMEQLTRAEAQLSDARKIISRP